MTGTYTELVVAIALFVATHSLPSIRPLRTRIVQALGERGYIGVYGLVSTAATFWIIVAATQVPYVEVWSVSPVARWAPNIIMPFATWLLLLGLTTPNVLSIRVRSEQFDPARPGAIAITRHPLLWAFALWGISHMAPNGDLGSIVLFGFVAVFSFFGCAVLDVRRRREFGPETWAGLARGTSVIPFAAIVAGRADMPWRDAFGWRLAVAVLAYVAAINLHDPILMASPFPL